jgi:hypothetical protein
MFVHCIASDAAQSLDGRQLIAVIMAVNKVDLKTDRAGKPFDDVEDVESAKLYASILAELHSKASKVTYCS